MRIAQIAGPLLPVPPGRYGGTERVVSTLTEELVRRGHDVTLFAAGGSESSANLIPVVPEPAWQHGSAYAYPQFLWPIVQGVVLRHLDDFDVLHSHVEFFGFPLARASGGRIVSTMHSRQDSPEAVLNHQEFRDVPLISISDSQRQAVPESNWLATVYNGIDVDEFTFRPEPGQYLAFLGRVSPDKGVDVAIRVAQRAGMPIKLAARPPRDGNSPEEVRDQAYYREHVLPLLEESDLDFVGEIDGSERDEFLGRAAALLFPVRWPEPFGLVMAEAMACGTPVIALRCGSVPEVIDDGVTGFVCDSEDGMVEASARIGRIDRGCCRAEVERRFSAAAMADGYERVYESVVASGSPAMVVV